MRVIMLGTGAALPDPDRCHTSILITVGGRHYLVDCGHGATRQLVRAHVDPATVNTVFLTHLHYDHIADFPFFLISSWICNREEIPTVVGPAGTRRFVEHLFADGAFAVDIEARAQYPLRQKNFGVLTPTIREIEAGPVYEDDRIRVTAVQVEHIPREISDCFGLRFDAEGRSVVFASDTAPCESVIEISRGADVLIHDCTFPEQAIEFRKKAGIGTWAHTSPADLGEIAARAEVKCLVPTHFAHFDTTNPVVKNYLGAHMPEELIGPGLMDEVVEDIRKSYKGPLRIAHDLLRIDL